MARTELSSVLIGTSPLSAALIVSLVLAVTRPLRADDPHERERLQALFLTGVALQCVHFLEELLTGFHHRWPELLGLSPWTPEFFVCFNVTWIGLWVLSAVGLRSADAIARVALAPTWFFAIGMTLNGVAHPALGLRAGGYFPGLVTSPFVGVAGALLLARLVRVTGPQSARDGTG